MGREGRLCGVGARGGEMAVYGDFRGQGLSGFFESGG